MKMFFRDQFKFYKNSVPVDLSEVVDFNEAQIKMNEDIKLISCFPSVFSWEKSFGMKNPSDWKVYSVLNKPGLVVVKNPFHFLGQRYWIMKCLEYFTKKPNKLNIDSPVSLNFCGDWWEYCQRMKETKEGALALKKLRWITFGYHHNWDTKKYSESVKCDFPADLNLLCKKLAEALNFSDFNAEAAIVNMYHFGSTLSGHIDCSELNLTAPLFSFSFGQSAIFLIGGKTLDEKALPILIESGDIVVMSGESRLCYHGVPRILPAKKQTWNINDNHKKLGINDQFLCKEVIEKISVNKYWEPFDSYVNKSRINMNVRQVLFPGQKNMGSMAASDTL